MVFFNCNACGESLKKNQVEKHYTTKCRRCEVLSCVDCGKEFWGDDYKVHIKCISEEEKYSGKNYKPKPNANKGEKKQEQWINQVQSAIEKTSSQNPRLTPILTSLMDYPNIPRKKAKFENFMSNSVRVRDFRLVTQCWDALSVELSPPAHEGSKSESEETKDQEMPSELDTASVEKKSKKANDDGKEEILKAKAKKKRTKDNNKNEEFESHDTSSPSAGGPEDNCTLPKFKLKRIVVDIVSKRGSDGISMKKLQKKVLHQFAARGDGKSFTEEKLLTKLKKTIDKNTNLQIVENRVKCMN